MARLGLLVLASLFFAPPFGPLPKGKPKPKVIQPKPGVLQPSKPSCGTYNVSVPALSNVDLHPVGNRGSTDVGGKHTLELDARARHTDKRLRIDLEVSVRSSGKYRFERYRAHSMFFVDAKIPSGCRIEAIESNSNGEVKHTRDSHNFRRAHGSGLLDEATCKTDTNGDDVGKLKCSKVTFKTVRVRTTADPSRCDALRVPIQVTVPVHSHKGGDKDMGGNPVDLSIDGRYRRSGEKIFLDTTVRMREAEPDHTTFEGSRSDLMVDVARDYPTCKIRRVPTKRPRLRATTRPTHGPIFFNAQNGNPVLEDGLGEAYCRTDSNGSEHKQLSCSSVYFENPGIGLERR